MPLDIFNNLLTLIELFEDNNHDPIRSIVTDIVHNYECYNLSMLCISGKDLIAAGMNPGKEIGETLEVLLEAVMENPSLNEKHTLLRLMKHTAPYTIAIYH